MPYKSSDVPFEALRLPERLFSRIEVDVETGCWLWLGGKSGAGYGVAQINGRTRYMHRAVYELLGYEIPEGLVLDHVHERGCRHKHCVNPVHLEPVTISENARRGQLRRWGKL